MKRRWIIYLGMVIMVLLMSCDEIAKERVGMDITDLTLYISFTQPIMRIYGDEAQLESFVDIYKKANGKAFNFYHEISREVHGFEFRGIDAAYASNSKSSVLLHRSQIQHDLEGRSYIEISWQDDIPVFRWWYENVDDTEWQSEDTTMALFSSDLFTSGTDSVFLIFEHVVSGVIGKHSYTQRYSEVSRDEEGITFGLCEAGMSSYVSIGNPYFSKCPG